MAVAHALYVWSMFFLFFVRALDQFHKLWVLLFKMFLHLRQDRLRDMPFVQVVVLSFFVAHDLHL